MTLTYASILLPIGLLILVKGADWLVDGAVAIAHRLGMSPLIIGLTIVAMGTSAPEVAASIAATLSNSADMAIGNVYGSNIANLALVGGLCSIIRPIRVSRPALFRDIPIMLTVSGLLYFLFYNLFLGRSECLVMLILFIGIILFMIHSERKNYRQQKELQEKAQHTIDQATHHPPKTLWASFLLILVGLVGLSGGAKLTVESAKFLGGAIGLSDAVIGSTIVAIGTSLPELTTCLVAALKKHDDLSVGNLVGSNIFNTLLVIGTAGLVKPFTVSERMVGLDYGLMIGVTILFSIMALLRKQINRVSGIVLFTLYCGYLGYLFLLSC